MMQVDFIYHAILKITFLTYIWHTCAKSNERNFTVQLVKILLNSERQVTSLEFE